MRIVRWSPQERVDLPDITQMSFLALGEFRRTVRALLQGEDDNRVVRGFLVEPATIPDSTITVRLVPAAGENSLAIGAENLGAVFDHGQLIGDKDSTGTQEGNALQTADFAAEPSGKYRLQMRFVPYDQSTGEADNRAFWNPASNTEFVASVDTKFVPQWELGIAASPGSLGAEWVPLADISWTFGGTIPISEITDLRPFVFEGSPPFDVTTQDAAGAFPDFDRSATRGDLAVQVNEVYRVLRALGRQIMDLKGQDRSGNFNWYGRLAGPVDPGTALATEQTRSLRTVDTVMFTVGDGVTTFGDFYGATGLEDCLQHIEDMGANTPNSIEIVCKSRTTGAPAPFVWPVTTAHAISASCDRLVIDYQGNSSSFLHPVATSALSVLGELEVRNMAQNAAPANNATLFEADTLLLYNCVLVGNASATSAPAVEGRAGTQIADCIIAGRILIDNPGGAPAGTDDLLNTPAHVRASFIIGAIEVTTTPLAEKYLPLHLSDTTIRMQRNDGFGQTAVIDLNNNEACVIDGCTIIYVPAVHAIEGVDVNARHADNLRVTNTKFRHSDVVPTSTGGFGIALNGCDNVQISNCDFDTFQNDGGCVRLEASLNTQIENCQFRGFDTAGRAAVDSCVYLDGSITNLQILGCQFDGWNPNTGTTNGRTIRADATAAISQLSVVGCQFRSCGGYCVQLSTATSLDGFALNSNSVNVPEVAGLGFNIGTGTNGAIVGNQMFFTTPVSSGINAGATGDSICVGNILNGGFIATTGAVLYGKAGGGGPTDLNYEV